MIRAPEMAIVGLGANLSGPEGQSAQTLAAALTALAAADCHWLAVSRFYRSPAYPAGSGPDYVNAVALFQTALAPDKLLTRLHEIEASHGRARTTRWGVRSLDLDLLALGDAVLPDRETQGRWADLPPAQQAMEAPATLILPHPRLSDRAFVLRPLAEIAPRWCHPVSGQSAAGMLERLPPEAFTGLQPFA